MGCCIGWRVPILSKRVPTVYMHCERCRLPFEPMKGGLCERCDRILCPNDLHGSLFARWRAAVTRHAVCVECRARQGE